MERYIDVLLPYLLSLCCLDVSLSELQKTLDTQSIEVVDNQKESVLARKLLLEQTKGAFIWRLIW